MSAIKYNEDQYDALQEVTNVAMGQAGASLAKLLKTFVVLSVPKSRIVGAEDVSSGVAKMIGSSEAEAITSVRQAFFGQMLGEAIAIFEPQGCKQLADLIGFDSDVGPSEEEELLLDVSNLLVGACIGGLVEQFGMEVSYDAPAIMWQDKPIFEMLDPAQLKWDHALLIEVNFRLEERGFRCHLVLMMPENNIALIRDMLDEMLDEL